jgi:hypothetical protein
MKRPSAVKGWNGFSGALLQPACTLALYIGTVVSSIRFARADGPDGSCFVCSAARPLFALFDAWTPEITGRFRLPGIHGGFNQQRMER